MSEEREDERYEAQIARLEGELARAKRIHDDDLASIRRLSDEYASLREAGRQAERERDEARSRLDQLQKLFKIHEESRERYRVELDSHIVSLTEARAELSRILGAVSSYFSVREDPSIGMRGMMKAIASLRSVRDSIVSANRAHPTEPQ